MSAEYKKGDLQLRGEYRENMLFVVGSESEGQPLITIMAADNLVKDKGFHAGQIIREAAKLINGGGGGQPHFATAGGKNPDGLAAAVEKVIELAKL